LRKKYRHTRQKKPATAIMPWLKENMPCRTRCFIAHRLPSVKPLLLQRILGYAFPAATLAGHLLAMRRLHRWLPVKAHNREISGPPAGNVGVILLVNKEKAVVHQPPKMCL
jgi:hypothetical protein